MPNLPPNEHPYSVAAGDGWTDLFDMADGMENLTREHIGMAWDHFCQDPQNPWVYNEDWHPMIPTHREPAFRQYLTSVAPAPRTPELEAKIAAAREALTQANSAINQAMTAIDDGE